MIDPLYYQYEVRAAPDGKSADIIARGDLDGNGKTSQYLLHVNLDARQGKLIVAPKLDVKDGEE